MYVLEGEALMNDASGLTTFKFAVAAAATGAFSLSQASISFAWVAIGGIGVGVLLGWALGVFQQWLAGWTQVEVQGRSEEHTSELQSLMRTSYAVFCLKKKSKTRIHIRLSTRTE